MSLLEITDLRTVFATEQGEVAAVDDVSFTLEPGEVLGIVGESGSGKSVTALSIMGLLPRPPARIASGSIASPAPICSRCREAQMRRMRGPGIAMIFQEPMTSLNPVFTIGDQIMRAIRAMSACHSGAARRARIAMLGKVGIPAAARRLDDYPHQLSGGMRQRVMIAMALACNPKLLIADEPTTALDVTVQAQILDLLLDLRDELGMAVMIITHDLGVVAEIADRVLVMYAGKIVEEAPVDALFDAPAHPYTRGLLDCVPLARGRPRAAAHHPRQRCRPGAPLRRAAASRRAARLRDRRLRRGACRRWSHVAAGHTAACIRSAELAAR